MTEATGWPPEPPPEVVAPEPAPPEPAPPEPVAPEPVAPEPVAPEPVPAPDWLAEVRNNVGGIVGAAIEELYKLVTGG
jgi:hypothetical protein